MRGLASFTRSTALSNGMDAQRSTGVLLSRPAAAQRCAEGAGLDSGAAVKAQSAMPSIALPCSVSTAHSYPPTPAASTAPQLQPRISTSLTDVTLRRNEPVLPVNSAAAGEDAEGLREPGDLAWMTFFGVNHIFDTRFACYEIF